MAKQSPRAYPLEFRRKVIAVALDGRSLKSLSGEFGIARRTIMNWLKQGDLDAGRRDDGLTTSERQELTRLRHENERLKLTTFVLSRQFRRLRRAEKRASGQRRVMIEAHRDTG